MSDEEVAKVAWGTASLITKFDGVVREARIQKSEKSFDDKAPVDQLFLSIEPTSYEEAEERWPRDWYSIKYTKRSKWAVLQDALEKCGALPKESESELIGKEFTFERRDLEFGVNKTSGEKMVAEAIVPVKFIRDHNKTKGAKAPASSPKEEPEKEEKVEEVDTEVVIVEMAKKEPLKLEKLYMKLSKDYGVKRADAFKAIVSLQKQGHVKLNKEEGVLTAVE